jgi:C-terminal processing protease CtpA/Prc
MSYRNRALVALALTGALTVSGIVASGVARAKTSSHKTTEISSKGDGYLGVNLQELSDGLADSYDYKGSGVVVTSVVPGSPADKLGIEEGDIITRINQTQVNSVNQATSRIRAMEPGSLADITVWRDGSVHELGRAEIGDVDDAPSYTPRAPRAPRAPQAPRAYGYRFDTDDMKNLHGMIAPGRGRLGVETRDLDADLGSYFGTDHGVLVLHVVDETPASRAGLKAGDVILSVDGDPVRDTDDLRTTLRKKDEGNVELRVRRKNAERTITAKLEDRKEVGMWESGDHDWLGDNGMKVFRFRGPNGGGHAWLNGEDFNMEGLSDEDRAQLRKDLDKLREDLKELRKDRDRDDDDDND